METNCRYFPCHKGMTDEHYCNMCYCPLYLLECKGDYKLLQGGTKDCSNCMLPHTYEGQREIVIRLMEETW